MAESVGRTILVINGRVLEIGPPRTTHATGRTGWWACLALIGGTLLALGIPVDVGAGAFAAIGGVVLFVVAGVVVGSERYELATALGAAGVVWTSAGIAVDLGTDRSLPLSALVCAVVGAMLLFAGVRSALQGRGRHRRPGETSVRPYDSTLEPDTSAKRDTVDWVSCSRGRYPA